MGSLLYGTGMRLMECLRLRVKDVDFGYGQILVRDGKGAKDRITMLPKTLIVPLQDQLQRARQLHNLDLHEGYGEVHLPYALARKYPRAGFEWNWQYLFPSKNRSADPDEGVIRRHHIDESVLQRAIKKATKISRYFEACALPHAAAFVCHASITVRLRYPYRPGIVGALRRINYDDLYPRPQPRWSGRLEPAGRARVNLRAACGAW